MNPLYHRDFVAWADQTVQLLREHRWEELDLENLIEEVEDLGNRHRDALRSQLTRLLMHLLKWRYQTTSFRGEGSWRNSINEARKQIRRLQKQYPSLVLLLREFLRHVIPMLSRMPVMKRGFQNKGFPAPALSRLSRP